MKTQKNSVRRMKVFFLLLTMSVFAAVTTSAHCDSYDGPVIKDAMKALETNNVKLLLKWIDQKQEPEIISLFNKTYQLRNGDKQIYEIVEKHFFETLVRLHRETEGAPYTGLKPAGMTKQIILMSDNALNSNKIDDLLARLDSHINQSLHEKYEKVVTLSKVKDTSAEKGREYVQAYIDYTHTIESLHDIIDHSGEENIKHEH
jgi:hypothetical protein